EFAVPVTARNARIVIWQMNEARVPSELVEPGRPSPITDMGRRHQRVKHDHSRCSSSLRAGKEIGARNIVSRKSSFDRTAPGYCRGLGVFYSPDKIDPAAAGRCGIIPVRREFFALSDVALHFLCASPI